MDRVLSMMTECNKNHNVDSYNVRLCPNAIILLSFKQRAPDKAGILIHHKYAKHAFFESRLYLN